MTRRPLHQQADTALVHRRDQLRHRRVGKPAHHPLAAGKALPGLEGRAHGQLVHPHRAAGLEVAARPRDHPAAVDELGVEREPTGHDADLLVGPGRLGRRRRDVGLAVEHPQQRRGVRQSAVELGDQRRLHRGEQPLGGVGAHLPQGRPVARRGALVERHHVVAGQRGLMCQQLVEHHAERPHIGAGVHRAGVADLLGRHVARRAERDVGAGLTLPRIHEELGDPEVRHLGQRAPDVGDEHVVGLEIAVHGPARMSERHGLRDLPKNTFNHGQIRATIRHPAIERGAVNALHHQRRVSVNLDHIVHPHDARVVERRLDAPLRGEARPEIGPGAVQHLDRHRRPEVEVGRCVDRSHSASAQHRVDPIAAHVPPDLDHRSPPAARLPRPAREASDAVTDAT